MGLCNHCTSEHPAMKIRAVEHVPLSSLKKKYASDIDIDSGIGTGTGIGTVASTIEHLEWPLCCPICRLGLSCSCEIKNNMLRKGGVSKTLTTTTTTSSSKISATATAATQTPSIIMLATTLTSTTSTSTSSPASLSATLLSPSRDCLLHKMTNKRTNFRPGRFISPNIPNYYRIFLYILLMVCALNQLICIGVASADRAPPYVAPGGICQSKDIRNDPSQLNQLAGCRIVEGFVQILLIPRGTKEAYANISFPELTEITDYLLVFNANGLTTLGKIFPNLRIIRGRKLFRDYAFVIYNVITLEEIGLTSLVHIGRGAVRIEKNAMLCYVDSIDWTLIAPGSQKSDHYLSGNRGSNACPICTGRKSNTALQSGDDAINEEFPECPEARNDNEKTRLCWNKSNCQKVCPIKCKNGTCSDRGECCDDACVGGCSGPKPTDCFACRYLTLNDYQSPRLYPRKCEERCPAQLFEHMERRCINATQCYSVRRPIEVPEDKPLKPYIPAEGKCDLTCPVNFDEVTVANERRCKPCDGPCKKVCGGANIDSIDAAQQLKGCTHINGALEIQIKSQGGLNIVRELENSLSSIVEISDYLRVVRSYPLLSLNFLKNLKTIRGQKLDNQKYAIYVLDNQNLQDLWDKNHTVDISRGKLFFHFNPKLCFYKIEELKSMLNDPVEFVIEDVARSSNGDKVACRLSPMNVTVKIWQPYAVVLQWDPIHFDDERSLLGYVVYYAEAPYQNVTMYVGRDACGGDGWHVDDVSVSSQNGAINHLITHLEPYTQYAYYVKTYTISTESSGAQSPIQYFRTLPGTPETVQKLQVNPQGANDVIVSWDPPKKGNGNLVTYIIKGKLNPDNAEQLEQRNYCHEPLKRGDPQSIFPVQPELPKPSEVPPLTCDCENKDVNPRRKLTESEDAEQQISFEDALHNWVYIKKKVEHRNKRQAPFNNQTLQTSAIDDGVPQEFPDSARPKTVSDVPNDEKIQKRIGPFWEYVYFEVNASITSIILQELQHYSVYYISVRACREGPILDPLVGNCSVESTVQRRTMKIDGADDIPALTAVVDHSNQTVGAVRLSWQAPAKPNSIIVTYTIRYQRCDIEHSKHQVICITQRHYQKLSGSTFVLTGLETGNYSVEVMATSMAGDGRYTPKQYFYIEYNSPFQKYLILIILACSTVVFVLCAVFYVRRRYSPQVSKLELIASVNPEYVSMQYTLDEWEVPRDKIIQLNELGQGSFGMVYEGIIKNMDKQSEEKRCAIKTVNENATDRERSNFLKEASVMKAFDTHHVVRLLGVVSRGQPTLVIMELMANGDLKGYLRLHRPEPEILKKGQQPPQPPTLKRVLQMAIEIADGMAYLSAKKFVHRDLAARNCMVADDLTVKIGDFGMTRDIYETDYYRKGTKGLLPVRWMSPESLKDGIFTSSSDVFSYGVVLWEMATLASQPYQGLSNDQVLRYVIDGGVMERPENCPDKLYDMMRRCWQHRPSGRPTFLEIVSTYLDEANPTFRNLSFYFSIDGQELYATQQKAYLPIDDVTTPLRQGDDALSLDVDDNYLANCANSNLVNGDDGPLPALLPTHSPIR